LNFLKKVGNLLNFVDDDRLLQASWVGREQLLPQQGRAFGEFQEEIGLEQVIDDAVRICIAELIPS
jgi:hypothetical protein